MSPLKESGNALCRYSLKYRGNRLRENIIPVEWYCLYYTTGYVTHHKRYKKNVRYSVKKTTEQRT